MIGGEIISAYKNPSKEEQAKNIAAFNQIARPLKELGMNNEDIARVVVNIDLLRIKYYGDDSLTIGDALAQAVDLLLAVRQILE